VCILAIARVTTLACQNFAKKLKLPHKCKINKKIKKKRGVPSETHFVLAVYVGRV